MCGLFGFSGHKKADLTKIKLLAAYNVDRGKNSTGVFINNEVIKDVGDAFKFLEKNELEYTQNKERVVFGHTRNASSGAVNKTNAHPFWFIKSKENKDDEDEFHSAFAHNGTLHEWKDDLKKYIDTFKYDVDSRALGALLTKLDYNYLSEYQGAITYLRTDYRYPNTLEVFKGASIVNGVKEADRPMFALKTKEGVYFSSMLESLEAIKRKGDEFIDIPINKVLRFTNGELDEENSFEVHREVKKHFGTATQYRLTTKTSGSTSHQKSRNSVWKSANSSTNSKIGSSSELSHVKKKSLASEKKGKTSGFFWSNSIPFSINVFRGAAYYNKGRYYRNGHLLDSFYTSDVGGQQIAPYYLDEDGREKSSYSKNEIARLKADHFKKFYFYKGMMLPVKNNEGALDIYKKINPIFRVIRKRTEFYSINVASSVISRYVVGYFAFLNEELPKPVRRFGVYYNGSNILSEFNLNKEIVLYNPLFMRKVNVNIDTESAKCYINDPWQIDFTAKELSKIINLPVLENKDYPEFKISELLDNFGPYKKLVSYFFSQLDYRVSMKKEEKNENENKLYESVLVDDLEQLSGDLSLFIERLETNFYGDVRIAELDLEDIELDLKLENLREEIDSIVSALKNQTNDEKKINV